MSVTAALALAADLERERDNLAALVADLMFELRVALYNLDQREREVTAFARARAVTA